MSHTITCEICDYTFQRDRSPEYKICYWCEVDDYSDNYGINDAPDDAEEDRRWKWLGEE